MVGRRLGNTIGEKGEAGTGYGVSQAIVEADERTALGLFAAPDQGGGELKGVGGPQRMSDQGLFGKGAQSGGWLRLRPYFVQVIQEPTRRCFTFGEERTLPGAAGDRRDALDARCPPGHHPRVLFKQPAQCV
jgi:hypothetical protein